MVMRPGFWKVTDTFDLYEGDRGSKVGSAFVDESTVSSALRIFMPGQSVGIRISEDQEIPRSPSIWVRKAPSTFRYGATVHDWEENEIGGYSKTFAWGRLEGMVINDASGSEVAVWGGGGPGYTESFVTPARLPLLTIVPLKFKAVPEAQVSLFLQFDFVNCRDPIVRALLLGLMMTSKIGGLV